MESDEESGSTAPSYGGPLEVPLLSASLFSGTRSERLSDCPRLALR